MPFVFSWFLIWWYYSGTEEVRMRYALIFGYKAQLSILLTKSMILENGSKWNLINDKGTVDFR